MKLAWNPFNTELRTHFIMVKQTFQRKKKIEKVNCSRNFSFYFKNYKYTTAEVIYGISYCLLAFQYPIMINIMKLIGRWRPSSLDYLMGSE